MRSFKSHGKRVISTFLAILMVAFAAVPMLGYNDSSALTEYKPEATHYIIFAKDTTFAMSIKGSSTANKANVQLAPGANLNSMHMKLKKCGSWYLIENCWSGKVLSVKNGKKADNVNVWQYKNNKAKSQQWRFYNAGNGQYYIKNRLGYYLTVSGSPASGANIYVSKKAKGKVQTWHLTKLSTTGTKMPYTEIQMITALNSNRIIDLKGGNLEPGARIQLHDNAKKTSQKFRVIDIGNGYYFLQNGCSNKYLEVKDGSTANGALATQWVGRGKEKQQMWRFVPCGDGYYYIQSALGKYLTVGGHADALRAPICLEKGQAISAQKWKIKETNLGTDTYINRAKKFIADSRWKNGVSWGNRTPKLAPGADWHGCAAYCYDWGIYMYGKGIRDNGVTEYKSVASIKNGDVIHVNDKHGTHWFVVVSRNGNWLKTAEGNVDPKGNGNYITRVSTSAYEIRNGKIYSYLTKDYRTVTEAFRFEDHMYYDK